MALALNNLQRVDRPLNKETQTQTNDFCQIELFEIELFDHLTTVCKQMTDI